MDPSHRLWWRTAPRLVIAALAVIVFGYLGWRDYDTEQDQRRQERELERCLEEARAASERTGATVDEAGCFVVE